MIRLRALRLILVPLAAVSLVLAQDQPPPSPADTAPGGWRRVPEDPQQPLPPATSQPAPTAQFPSQPVPRTDAYGQPMPAGPQATPVPRMPPPGDQDAPPQGPPPRNMPSPDRPPQAYAQPVYNLPPQLTLKPGTYVTILTNQMLSSDRNQPGDVFSGSLLQPIVVDGIVVAQRGQNVYGRVAEALHARSDQSSRLGLQLTGLTLADGTQVDIHSQLVGRQGSRTPTGDQVGTVAATTGVGAVIGAAAGWGTGAAIGAGVGAAAGIIGVLVTRNRPTVVYPETALTFQVESPVAISTVNAPHAFRYVAPDEYDRPVEQPRLQQRPAAGPPPPYYGPYPYYGYGYPYPYWGFGVSIYRGPGYGYGWGRGHYRRWR
jgi:hypothetical protein